MPSPSSSKPSSDSPAGSSSKAATSNAANQEKLPFEPRSNKSKASKSKQVPARRVPSQGAGAQKSGAGRFAGDGGRRESTIPQVVSQRMARRMTFFSGVPMLLGISTFVVSYFIVSRDVFELPTTAVLLVSLGFFGLSVGGLSYGVFSASWDEDREGSWLGIADFRTNVGRAVGSWKAARAEALSHKKSGSSKEN